MDPNTRLDHVLFQLTPTRTRCDLVVFSGGVNERLASGLLEPFLSHLKSAKDQISKGGYSIILRPASVHAQWFTKATLQRFVKFVSTPEVLERIVTIEKEIVQIENSVHSNEKSNLVAEGEDWRVKKSSTNQDGHEENPRIRLQRVLDNRKAMLCKEQAMAYARALVAGYYPESLDDLICFADAFGASRLREACINFLDLCKQKNEDKLWMDEIAAMQASSQPVLPYLRTSGIILAGEDDAGSKINGIDASESTPSHASFDMSQDYSMPPSAQTPPPDGRAQISMSWPNHLPHYMHNFQGHAFQHMQPPFQGYIYPGMQVPSSYYPPGNMQWPPNVEDSEIDYSKSSFKKKKNKKNKHSRVVDGSEDDASTASSDSSYESDSDEHSRQGKKKKHGKKSSRKVVIRNINYITSKGDGEKGSSSNDEEYINGDSLKRQVEEAVGPLERRHKSTSRRSKKQHDAEHHGMLNGSNDADSNGAKGGNENWNAFQNLLLRDDEPDTEKQPPKFEETYIVNKNLEDGRTNGFNHKQEVAKTRVVSNDSFIVTGREYSEGQNLNEYFREGKDAPSFMKKKDGTNDDFLYSHRNEESGHYSASTLSSFSPEPSLTKSHKEEDWFIMNQSDKQANEDGNKSFSMFNGVSISSSEKNKKDVLADDSFMIQARSSQSAADFSLVSDIVGAAEFAKKTQEVSRNKTAASNPHEPDDLFMVLDRDSAVDQSAAVPWSMEMDYENNISLNEANRKSSDVETDKKEQSNGEVVNTKAPGVRNGKDPSKDAKSKTLNGTLGRSKLDTASRSKASPGSRTSVMKSKSDKEEESRKRKEELLIQRQKRIAERSASKKTGTDTKTPLSSAKKEKPKVLPSNEDAKKLQKPVLRNSTIDRLSTARATQKVEPSPAKSGPTKKPPSKPNGVPLQKIAGTETKKQGTKEVKSLNKKEDMKKGNGKVLVGTNGHAKNEMKASKVLPENSVSMQSVEPNNNHSGLKDNGDLSKTSSEKNVKILTSGEVEMDEKVGQIHKDSSLPNYDHENEGNNVSRSEEPLNKSSSLPNVTINPIAASHIKPIIVSPVNSKANQEIDEGNDASFEAPKKQIYTPPPPLNDQLMPEPVHSRKKWNNDVDSSKAAKGFRKLLFFGRRS